MTVLQGEMHEQLAVGRGPEGQGIAQGRGSPSPNTDGRGTAGSAPHSQLSTVSRFTGRSKTPQRTLTWPKWVCRSHGPLPSRLLLRNAWTTGPQKCTWLTDKKDQDLPGPSICTTSQQWLGPCGEMSPAFQGQNSGFPSGENPQRQKAGSLCGRSELPGSHFARFSLRTLSLQIQIC